MLIVISHALFFNGEAQLLNALFNAGLSLLHLRKPGATREDYEGLVAAIQPQYRSRVVLHHHHGIAGKYRIHRIHSPVQQHKELKQENLQNKRLVYSASLHEVEEYNSLSPVFSYAFLSPVFDSISKPGYLSKEHDLTKIKTARSIQLIALGGINRFNAKQVIQKGYDGMALCGAIWEAKKPIDEFLTIEKQWNTTVQ